MLSHTTILYSIIALVSTLVILLLINTVLYYRAKSKIDLFVTGEVEQFAKKITPLFGAIQKVWYGGADKLIDGGKIDRLKTDTELIISKVNTKELLEFFREGVKAQSYKSFELSFFNPIRNFKILHSDFNEIKEIKEIKEAIKAFEEYIKVLEDLVGSISLGSISSTIFTWFEKNLKLKSATNLDTKKNLFDTPLD